MTEEIKKTYLHKPNLTTTFSQSKLLLLAKNTNVGKHTLALKFTLKIYFIEKI